MWHKRDSLLDAQRQCDVLLPTCRHRVPGGDAGGPSHQQAGEQLADGEARCPQDGGDLVPDPAGRRVADGADQRGDEQSLRQKTSSRGVENWKTLDKNKKIKR